VVTYYIGGSRNLKEWVLTSDWGGFVTVSLLLYDRKGWVVGGGYVETQRMWHNSMTRKCSHHFSLWCVHWSHAYMHRT